MKVVTDIRKSAPAQAVVGVTDLAVGKLRSAQADLSAKASTLPGLAVARAGTLRAELRPAKIQADVQNLPNRAISKTLEVAGKAEETYDDLTARGKWLVESLRRHSSSQDLRAQGRSTVSLGKAAVTTVRKASDETLGAAKATLATGRREAVQLAGSLIGDGKPEAKAAKPAAKKATKPAVKKAAAKKATKPAAKPVAKKASHPVAKTASKPAATSVPAPTATTTTE